MFSYIYGGGIVNRTYGTHKKLLIDTRHENVEVW